jgi:hypothetical protein
MIETILVRAEDTAIMTIGHVGPASSMATLIRVQVGLMTLKLQASTISPS